MVSRYVSCIAGCPYTGSIDPNTVASVSSRLVEMGCYEVSLGDTVGFGTPRSIQTVIEAVLNRIPIEKIAVHFHDTVNALNRFFVKVEIIILVWASSRQYPCSAIVRHLDN
jgi:hydroxymethylglutaryl-CoA lyase